MEQPKEEQLHFLDYWRVIRSRKEIILAVTLLVVLTGVAFTLMLPKTFMADARILVREDSLDVDVFERQAILGYNPVFMRTQYEMIQSRQILYQVINNLNLQQVWGEEINEDGAALDRENTYRILSRSVKVEQFRETSMITIQVYRESSEEAAQIANEIASVYRDFRLSSKRREIKRAVEALEQELKKQQDKVDLAEQEVERIRSELGLSIMGPAGQGFRADKLRLQQLEADRIGARVEMLVRKARLDQLESLTGEELMSASAYMVQDQVLSTIRAQLIDSEVSLKIMLESYGPNHPEVKRLQAGVDELKKKLATALNGLKKGLRAEYEVALSKFNALETELQQARKADIETERESYLPFQRAEREMLVQREILNALRARVAQQGIEMEVPRTPVELVDPAEAPSRPVSPNLILNLLLSLVLGLGAGISLAYFIEYLDTSVKTVDDVEHYLSLPVLGVIPQKVRPLTEEGPDSPHAEVYRVLKTNMQFANKGVSGGAYALVSGGVGEGKSTTLFNLAYVCAQLGEKVLVVDSDLRRPVQHTFLKASNRFGLTNVLMRDVPIEETIKTTSIPNLHFLPSGKLPRSSFGLLDSQRMRELIKNLKARYDYVFFDSPPIMGVTDASILASEVDGVMLVVQYRKYPRQISLRAKRMLENVGGNVLGVILNNINILRDDYYYYYHSYYSHYEPSEEARPEEPGASASSKKDAL
ncbi:MAG TPA: polysaccharide biosynthesis tyrosine autokinase [Kiritimatiellia bacterium]|nr:polysaccharide biosynthesis tyrosine autokinase [Kiritimatiellia bacterium]HSA18908.1 polysaccharide biosynthesis tyrosine autokinase [Kiritimatiellia bacterium]